jgi:uncharacterized protein DUF5924/DUF2914 family protein
VSAIREATPVYARRQLREAALARIRSRRVRQPTLVRWSEGHRRSILSGAVKNGMAGFTTPATNLSARDQGLHPSVAPESRYDSPVRRFVRKVMPWISLGLGVASAIWMDRRPERAPVVAIAAAGGWLLMALLSILESMRSKAVVARAARAGAAMGSQSMVQMCLFFSAPFFGRAASIPAHWVFVGIIGVAGLITLWSPLVDATMRHPIFGAPLLAVATFAGFDCVLPLLGFSNRDSLLIAVAATAGGSILIALLRHRGRIAALVVAAAMVAGYIYGGARFIPPAPLRLENPQMGTSVIERRLAGANVAFSQPPPQLVCFTPIVAPRGLQDHLRHVWRQNGTKRMDISLEVRGGRDKGFRTWSTYHGPAPGHWTCTVETESGQRLGRVSAHIGS